MTEASRPSFVEFPSVESRRLPFPEAGAHFPVPAAPFHRVPDSILPVSPGRSLSQAAEWLAEAREGPRSTAAAPVAAGSLPAWPELSGRADDDLTDECLALVREQRRLDARDAEQRGKPWSA